MDDQESAYAPSTNVQENSLGPSPLTEPAIQKAEVANHPRTATQNQQDPTTELKREFKLFEKLSIAINVLLAVVGIGALCIYKGRLDVMRGTLEEMKRSGIASTDQMWQAINNLNWTARSMDGSVKETRHMMASTLRAVFLFNASIIDNKVHLMFMNRGKASATGINGHIKTGIRLIKDGSEIYHSNNVVFSESVVMADGRLDREIAFDTPSIQDIADKMIIILQYRINYFDGFDNNHQTACRVVTHHKEGNAISGFMFSCDALRLDPQYRVAMRAIGKVPEEQ